MLLMSSTSWIVVAVVAAILAVVIAEKIKDRYYWKRGAYTTAERSGELFSLMWIPVASLITR